jgi:hypothetical protein
MENIRPLGHQQNTKLTNHGCRRRRRNTSKGIDDLFSNIIAEKFPNLMKGRGTKQARSEKKHPTHIIKTLNILYLKNIESCKREVTSHI